jgi:hypothetical protein
MPAQTVLAFDIGIRNLAWCILRKSDISGTPIEVLGWENFDLVAGNAANIAGESKISCAQCAAKPTYETKSAKYCVRHCPLAFPAFRDLSGNLVKKLPSAAGLREILQGKGLQNLPKSKGDLLKKAADLFSLPILTVKVKKAVETELTVLHDSIRRFITDRKHLFHNANEILLENQPALKNPTMKSVQILLFATLRDILQPSPPKLRLVHAKVKVDAIKGDEGYKDRKAGSEKRVNEALAGTRIQEAGKWKAHLSAYTKKNDLTDAFCMCMDAFI